MKVQITLAAGKKVQKPMRQRSEAQHKAVVSAGKKLVVAWAKSNNLTVLRHEKWATGKADPNEYILVDKANPRFGILAQFGQFRSRLGRDFVTTKLGYVVRMKGKLVESFQAADHYESRYNRMMSDSLDALKANLKQQTSDIDSFAKVIEKLKSQRKQQEADKVKQDEQRAKKAAKESAAFEALKAAFPALKKDVAEAATAFAKKAAAGQLGFFISGEVDQKTGAPKPASKLIAALQTAKSILRGNSSMGGSSLVANTKNLKLLLAQLKAATSSKFEGEAASEEAAKDAKATNKGLLKVIPFLQSAKNTMYLSFAIHNMLYHAFVAWYVAQGRYDQAGSLRVQNALTQFKYAYVGDFADSKDWVPASVRAKFKTK